MNEFYRRSITGARSLVAIGVFLAMPGHFAVAQTEMEPPPKEISVAEQPGSPTEVKLTGVTGRQTNYPLLHLSIRNVGTSPVRAIILVANPGSTREFLSFNPPLQPGVSMSSLALSLRWKSEPSGVVISADCVLLGEGRIWGPDTSGQGDHLAGMFEGQKRALSDLKALLAQNDENALHDLITKRPFAATLEVRIGKSDQWRQGFTRGYGGSFFGLNSDLGNRGDMSGIPARIADLEARLELTPIPKDGRRQISRYWEPNEPVKIESIRIGERHLKIDERFESGSDWLKGLSIAVRNTSEKRIDGLKLSLQFAEAAPGGAMMVYTLTHGMNPSGTVKNTDLVTTPLEPGGTVTLALDAIELDRLKRFLGSRYQLDELTRMDIRIGWVTFADGLAWGAGSMMKRDPDVPNRYIPIN